MWSSGLIVPSRNSLPQTGQTHIQTRLLDVFFCGSGIFFCDEDFVDLECPAKAAKSAEESLRMLVESLQVRPSEGGFQFIEVRLAWVGHSRDGYLVRG